MKKFHLIQLCILFTLAFNFSACDKSNDEIIPKQEKVEVKKPTPPVKVEEITAKLVITYTGDTTKFSSEHEVYAIDSQKQSGFPLCIDNKEGFFTANDYVKQGGDLANLNDNHYEPSSIVIQKNRVISRTYTCTAKDIACLCFYEKFKNTKNMADYEKDKTGTITVNIKAYIKDKLQREVTYHVNRSEPDTWILFYSDKKYLTQKYDNDGIHKGNDPDIIQFKPIVD